LSDETIEQHLRGQQPRHLAARTRGRPGQRARAAILGQIENTSTDEDLVVIATGQYLGEGFDCPQLDAVFLAFPVSFRDDSSSTPAGSCIATAQR